jgi:hypothetical protein
MPTHPYLHSPRWRRFKQLVATTYGDVCHICGHGGAGQADHLESTTEHPELIFVLANCRPAHGAPGNPCPVCSVAAGTGIHCNQLRGGYSIERARKIIAEKIAANSAGRRSSKRYGVAIEQVTRKPEPPKENGREW